MKLVFAENAWEDYLFWQKTDKKTLPTQLVTKPTKSHEM